MGVIYSITFAGSRKRYVGSARNFRARLATHLHLLRKGQHHAIGLQRAADKYGLDGLTATIIEGDLPDGALIEREQHWIDHYKGKLYNSSLKAESRLGLTMSPEARAKISASLVGNSYRTGILHDDASRAKISAALKASYDQKRRKPSPQPQNLARFNKAVKRGDRLHPSRNPARDQAITEFHARTRSAELTAREFGITASAVYYVVRRINPSQLRKWSRRS